MPAAEVQMKERRGRPIPTELLVPLGGREGVLGRKTESGPIGALVDF